MKCYYRLIRAVGKRASCAHLAPIRPCGDRICARHFAEHAALHCKKCFQSDVAA